MYNLWPTAFNPYMIKCNSRIRIIVKLKCPGKNITKTRIIATVSDVLLFVKHVLLLLGITLFT